MFVAGIVALAARAGDGPTSKVEERAPSAHQRSGHGKSAGDQRAFDAIGSEYSREIRPLVTQFCLDCHSTAKQKGDLDLQVFSSLADVRRGTKVWLKVAEMLDNGEMPPKNSRQPSVEQRKRLRGWVQRYLDAEAFANAGDPGPVVLRRLSNAEYTYTIRDLTGVDLDPAREFPSDGAAGEGFTNAGNGLVMSPALLAKYFDAGREIAQHAVLLPDGFRFSPSTSRGDWTNEVLARIRALYREQAGTTQFNFEGFVFSTANADRLPVEAYLKAAFAAAEALEVEPAVPDKAAPTSGPELDRAIAAAAKKTGVSAKYLGILWATLNDRTPSLPLDPIRAKWRVAKRADVGPLAAEVRRWQGALWRFTSVGHIGKLGGPKAWQELVNPLAADYPVRLTLSPRAADEKDVRLILVASDAGDGNANDVVVWQRPRLVAPGGSELLLRDVRSCEHEMTALRDRSFKSTAKALDAVADAGRDPRNIDVAALAATYEVDADLLSAWLTYLGVGVDPASKLDHLTARLPSAAGHSFVNGWGAKEAPLLLANSSDQGVRIPGTVQPHSVCLNPSASSYVAVGWKSPIEGKIRISGKVSQAQPECGDGVVWRVELRRGATRQRIAEGSTEGGKVGSIWSRKELSVQPGDLVSLLVGPRGGHVCDLTDVSLVLKTVGTKPQEWNLTRDVSGNILDGNPHADGFGNEGVWHFYAETVQQNDSAALIPYDSVLSRWLAADIPKAKHGLGTIVEKVLMGYVPNRSHQADPDAVLYWQLTSLGGPLFLRASPRIAAQPRSATAFGAESPGEIGLDPALFGRRPDGSPIDSASLCVRAPSVLEIHLPGGLPLGTQFVADGSLDPQAGGEGSVQLQALMANPAQDVATRPISMTQTRTKGPGTTKNRRSVLSTPIITKPGSAARRRIESAFDQFRAVFPSALCYTKIVPADEVITLTLYHREDEPLRRLLLDDAEARRLDRLWDELHFISRDALKQVDALSQLLEYASQDADPSVFGPMRKPIEEHAAAFKKALVDAEPRQLNALVDFAARAYRRPLTDSESEELRGLYRQLRQKGLSHDEALRLTLARVFISPAFLYRRETAPAGPVSAPVSDWELASRLSYFLWSSQPDAELRRAAADGSLHRPDVLAKQARRLLADPRVRRLATEFACQWLQIYEFDALSEKSEQSFPEFARLRGDMYEESIRFFTDLFQGDGSVLGILDSDHTFVNGRLAAFYGMAGSPNDSVFQSPTGSRWRRVDGVRRYGRGGILGLSATLAKQSGASRTSPILRGNWVSEVLLGEKLPKPPKDVPRLPESETAADKLTVRQLVERHVSDRRCSACHQKFDPFGFALEGFDAIGRRRDRDLAGHTIDTKTRLPDGNQIDGLAGLRDYLAVTRRDAFVHQFCRKLLGYALGRGLQLSDDPLLAEMRQRLSANNYRFSAAIDAILASRQFREIRGRDAQFVESP